MKKFYYSPSNDTYFEIPDKAYDQLTILISVISSRYDEVSDILSFDEFMSMDPVAPHIEEAIKALLPEECYNLYKEAPLY